MKGKKIPMRQCVGCRESKEKKMLIRVVKIEEHTDDNHDVVIRIDRSGKCNGRGAYLCDCAGCLEKARKNNGLSRAFKMNVSDEIYDDLERQLSE